MSNTGNPWFVANNGKNGNKTPKFRILSNDPFRQEGMNKDGYACIARHVSGETYARLISAAPDLVEFVQQIFNGIDTGMITIDTPADETLANILSRGRKALSKAIGVI